MGEQQLAFEISQLKHLSFESEVAVDTAITKAMHTAAAKHRTFEYTLTTKETGERIINRLKATWDGMIAVPTLLIRIGTELEQ